MTHSYTHGAISASVLAVILGTLFGVGITSINIMIEPLFFIALAVIFMWAVFVYKNIVLERKNHVLMLFLSYGISEKTMQELYKKEQEGWDMFYCLASLNYEKYLKEYFKFLFTQEGEKVFQCDSVKKMIEHGIIHRPHAVFIGNLDKVFHKVG